MMPPSGALRGLPVVSAGGPLDPILLTVGPSTSSGQLTVPSGASATLLGVPVIASLANLLPLAASTIPPGVRGRRPGPSPTKTGVPHSAVVVCGYGGDASSILDSKGGGSRSKKGASSRRCHKVTDIFMWLQCYAIYVNVLGPHAPETIPELMAYMATIIRVSQDYQGLAWVRYEVGFRRQAALTGNRLWSRVNSTRYTVCFTGNGTMRVVFTLVNMMHRGK